MSAFSVVLVLVMLLAVCHRSTPSGGGVRVGLPDGQTGGRQRRATTVAARRRSRQQHRQGNLNSQLHASIAVQADDLPSVESRVMVVPRPLRRSETVSPPMLCRKLSERMLVTSTRSSTASISTATVCRDSDITTLAGVVEMESEFIRVAPTIKIKLYPSFSAAYVLVHLISTVMRGMSLCPGVEPFLSCHGYLCSNSDRIERNFGHAWLVKRSRRFAALLT